MPTLNSDEKAKEGTEIKILTPNKLLARFPVLLAGNNSYILKNKIRQKLYQHNKITKTLYSNLIKL